MFVNAKSLVVLIAAPVLVVQAQSGTETSTAAAASTSLSACLLQCVTTAAQSAGCSSFTDLACVCTSSSFQTAASQCLQANCTAADLQTGLTLAQQECASYTVSGTPESTVAATTTPASAASSGSSASSTHTSPAHTTTSGTTTSTSTSSSSSNAAVGLVPFALEGFFGTLIASAGALIGAAFVL
ncbi:hypothetical protein J3A83DRAFT_4367719 [Scleroderma citrinum]